MNFVKTKIALAPLQSGQVLENLLDDGAPIANVPGSGERVGHTVLATEKVDDYWRVTIMRNNPYGLSPITLRIRPARFLIVGGGRVATHKATILHRFTDRARVVAPKSRRIKALPLSGRSLVPGT
jgi:TusA-related sulfurtransferase